MGRFVLLRVVRNIFSSHPFKYTPFAAAAAAIQSPSTIHSADFNSSSLSVLVPDNQTNHKITNQTSSNNFRDITTSSSSSVVRGGIRVKKNLLSRKPAGVTHTTTTNNNTAVELAFNSVVKIFTVSCSPNYLLPWQNKSQRESMGSGLFYFFLYATIPFLPSQLINWLTYAIMQGL
jgi:hypothetical protein